MATVYKTYSQNNHYLGITEVSTFTKHNILYDLLYLRVGYCMLSISGCVLLYDVYVDGFTGDQYFVPVSDSAWPIFRLVNFIVPVDYYNWLTYILQEEAHGGQEES